MPTTEEWAPVRSRLNEIISERQLKLRDVAEQVGLTHAGLHLLLSGKSTKPYQRNFDRLVKWLRQQEGSLAYMEQLQERLGDAVGENFRAMVREKPGLYGPVDDYLLAVASNETDLVDMIKRVTKYLAVEHRVSAASGVLSSVKQRCHELDVPVPEAVWAVERRLFEKKDLWD